MDTTLLEATTIFQSREAPVDRRTALLLEHPVDPAEGSRPEEAAVRGERAGVHRLDPGDRRQLGLEGLGVAPPEDRGERRPLLGAQRERADGLVGDQLPAATAVRGGPSGSDGEAAVEHHHAGVGPGSEVTARGAGYADVVDQL